MVPVSPALDPAQGKRFLGQAPLRTSILCPSYPFLLALGQVCFWLSWWAGVIEAQLGLQDWCIHLAPRHPSAQVPLFYYLWRPQATALLP